METIIERYVALDVHKSYCMVGGVDGQQHVVLQPRKVAMDGLEDWASAHLKRTDAVVFEASVNAWELYDLLAPLVARVSVAHPQQVKLIAAARVKTDKRDTLALAQLLAAKLIPEVWVPPRPVRELRDLVAHRQRLMSARTAAKNRLQDILHRHKLTAPPGDLYGEKNRPWWDSLALPSSERLRVGHLFETIGRVSEQIVETERELAHLSVDSRWRTQATLLIQLPGIGLLNAMTILSAIGDVQRFASAKKVVGYAGLGARVHASGQTHRGGPLTKQGRTDLRRAMVEAAWTAVSFSAVWKARYEKLTARLGKMKAIVAIARKLLVVVWHVLTRQQADRQANPAAVQRSLLTWASRYSLATSLGVRRPVFVQQALAVLGIPSTSIPITQPTATCSSPT
jgi:transposase